MTHMIYRLTLDEHGQEDCTDFFHLMDAEKAFIKATRRMAVFSAFVRAYNSETFKPAGGPIYEYRPAG